MGSLLASLLREFDQVRPMIEVAPWSFALLFLACLLIGLLISWPIVWMLYNQIIRSKEAEVASKAAEISTKVAHIALVEALRDDALNFRDEAEKRLSEALTRTAQTTAGGEDRATSVSGKPSPSANVFYLGQDKRSPVAARVPDATPADSVIVTFHNLTAGLVSLFCTTPDGESVPVATMEPHGACGHRTRIGRLWVARDAKGRDLQRYVVPAGEERPVEIRSSF